MEERLLRFYLTCSHHNQSPLKLEKSHSSKFRASIYSFVYSAESQTQDLTHARQVLYDSDSYPTPLFLGEKLPKEAPKL